MIQVVYTPGFLKEYSKLDLSLKVEVREKVELFKEDPRHPFLKTHKLKGAMKGYFSFSVNYKYRVVFEYDTKKTVALLSVGGHDVYH
jgi:addiction module RelE/StbE family toxin